MSKLSNVYYYWSNSTFPSIVDKKICSRGSFPATKFYPYKAWLRNLTTISTTRNVACMYAHMHMPVRAEIWGKKLFPESTFSIKLGWLINIAHFSGVFVLRIPLSFYSLSGVKWIWMWSHTPWLRLLTKPTPILFWSICSSCNVVGLSSVRNMHSWA